MIRGQELAEWLARTHPGLLRKVAMAMPRRLGDDGLIDFDFSSIGEDLAPLSSVTSAVDNSSWLESFTPALVDVTADLPQTIDQISASPSFDLSTLLSAGAKAATGTVTSVAKAPTSSVGSFLSTPAGLTTLVNAASDYFKASASASNAAAQQAIVQAQAQRAAASKAPAPIGYATNPLTGQLYPVLNTNTGLVPVTQPMLSSLAPTGVSNFFNQYGLYIILGVGALMLISAMSNSNR